MPTDGERLIAAMRKLATECPDATQTWIDQFGAYTLGPKPRGPCRAGRLVGMALAEVFPEKHVRLLEMDTGPGLLIGDMLEKLDLEMTDKERLWIQTVSDWQNDGYSWGEAVERADAETK